MKILSKEQILILHKQLIDVTGELQGIRDEGLLDSALAAPFLCLLNSLVNRV